MNKQVNYFFSRKLRLQPMPKWNANHVADERMEVLALVTKSISEPIEGSLF
jgi:hypothetical protein